MRLRYTAGVDFRLLKLRVALSILMAGMALALLYHGILGWGFGAKYPYNTFLCVPESRFSDFFNARHAAMLPSPYTSNLPDGYFPSSYGIFYRLFTFSEDHWVCLTPFLAISMGAAILVTSHALRPLTIAALREWRRTHPRPGADPGEITSLQVDFAGLGLALVILGCAQPFVMVYDRANNEIYIAIFVALTLIFLSQGRSTIALLWLLPGICFKLYPAALLVLYLRRGKLRWIPFTIFAFFFINWASLASYPWPIEKSFQSERQAMAKMYQEGLLDQPAMAGSATPWNGIKFITAGVVYLFSDKEWQDNPDDLWYALHPVFEKELKVFSALSLLGAVMVTIYGTLVETEFLRRAIVLLIFLVTASPYGGDYKMLHIITALVAMLLITTRRPYDMLVTVLLALTLIPKREILLPFAGFTDGGARDVPISILVNPPFMLLAAALVIRDSLRCWRPEWSVKRLRGLLGVFQLPRRRPANIAPPPTAPAQPGRSLEPG